MGWSSPFISALESRTRSPQYILERVEVYLEPGAAWSAGSHEGLGTETRIGVRGVQVQGSTLSPRGWSTTIGAFSVQLVGDVSGCLSHLTRGTIVALKVGFDGMAAGDFEVVALGQVKNLRGRPPVWTLECHDIMSAFRQRLIAAYAQTTLFSNVGSTTTLTADAAVGAGTYNVVGTSAFDKEVGGSAIGAFLVTTSSGDPYYRLWSAKTGTTLTISSAGTASRMGTTDVGAVTGDTITDVAYFKGHPLDIVRKILTSKQTGNGSYDTLPSQWGLGLSQLYIDNDDIDEQKANLVRVSSGSYEWEFVVTEPQTDCFSFLNEMLSKAGLFFTSRQGRLTVRGAMDTHSAVYGFSSGFSITDNDIEQVEEYEAWESGHDVEYGYVTVRSATNLIGPSGTTDPATMPCSTTLQYDISDRVFSNETAVCNEVVGRVTDSARRIPERLVLRCAGLRLAQLAPGDKVWLSTKQAHSRRDGAGGFDEAAALVVEISPDWDGGRVRVGVLVYPESEDVFA